MDGYRSSGHRAVPTEARYDLVRVQAAASDYVVQVRNHPTTRRAIRQFHRLPREGQVMTLGVATLLVGTVLMCLLKTLLWVAFWVSLASGGALLSSKRPAIESFEPAFRSWFRKDYFPKVAAQLAPQDQQHRGLLSWLPGQTGASWLPGGESDPEEAAYRFYAARCLPAQISDWVILRTARVNLGSPERPNFVTFLGVCSCWIIPPRVSVDGGNVSIVEQASEGEEDRGGRGP